MEKQKKQLLILVIALVFFVAAYFAVTHFAKGVTQTESGPNAYMGSVTEDVTEETTEASTESTSGSVAETVDGTEVE